jgi:hypothetical protein
LPTRISGSPNPVLHIVFSYHREGIRVLALRVHPENWMGDMNDLMRINCAVNLIQALLVLSDEVCEPLHICIGPSHKERPLFVAKVVLRVNGD